MASMVSTVAVGMISHRNSSMEVSRTSGIRGTDTSLSTHNSFNYPLSSSSSSYGLLRSRRSRSLVVVKAEAQSINPEIRKSEDKVVDSVVVTELSKPLTAYCRCWRSGTFPLCDGSHVKHNKASGDNVGPLLLKKQ